MTDSCWLPQVIRGDYVLNTLFGLEWVWNRHGTCMERTPSATSTLRYCMFWSGMEGSGTEFEDLFQISGSRSGSGCVFPPVPDQSY